MKNLVYNAKLSYGRAIGDNDQSQMLNFVADSGYERYVIAANITQAYGKFMSDFTNECSKKHLKDDFIPTVTKLIIELLSVPVVQ
jgi:hypothetical protein